MENAANAVNKLFAKDPAPVQAESEEFTNSPSNASAPTSTGSNVDQTVDSEVAPAVEHTHVKKQHETREQTFVEKEKHQDHYHTTIQPLKDSEVLPEKHDHIQETEHRSINNDDGAAKAKAEADRARFESTSEQEQFESKTQEPTQEEEHVHHHLHETVQPVIEKEVIDPSVTHKRIDVKEKIQEPAKHEGVTTNSAVSVDEFKKKLNGEKK
ncbi:uncharacterized protein PAC_03659 [Phialocephala subalpina]|uniref:Allergen n=1 Tax=Phialocephala subalpina TaxID=576137 RepID=A0A1L7WLX7_9HELO|nr:uncharacterized protein PAC_03659 [Phialocephala subalpina]